LLPAQLVFGRLHLLAQLFRFILADNLLSLWEKLVLFLLNQVGLT